MKMMQHFHKYFPLTLLRRRREEGRWREEKGRRRRKGGREKAGGQREERKLGIWKVENFPLFQYITCSHASGRPVLQQRHLYSPVL